MLVALLALFAFGAVAAAVAQGAEEEAPFWSIKKVRLGAGETHYISAKVSNAAGEEAGSFILETAGLTITCTKLKLKEGVLLGSAVGEPGKNDEVIEIEKCTQTGNGAEPGCKIKEPIVTKNVKSELVTDVTTHEKLLVEFKPEKGTVFTTTEFVEEKPGTKQCKLLSTKVSGEVAAEVLSDPKTRVTRIC
jgi:hypothetical protein